MPDEPGEVLFEMRLSSETLPGVYANYLTAWHTAYEFTLDFGVTQPAENRLDEEGNTATVVPVDVVARVKVPPTLIFDVIRALNSTMTRYEQRFGEIRRPGDEEVNLPADLLVNEDPPADDDNDGDPSSNEGENG